jgi:hypothetical protein
MNVDSQCKSCNERHNHYPEIYTQWWLTEHGQEAYDELVRKSWEIWKPKRYELEVAIEHFKRMCKALDQANMPEFFKKKINVL